MAFLNVRGVVVTDETSQPQEINANQTMSAVTALARQAFSGCDAASITVIEDGHPHTVAATHDLATAIDERQYSIDDGPCLHSARTCKTVRVDSYAREHDWPPVSDEAMAQGVLSSLSLPLVVEERAVGALNLYSFATAAFAESEEAQQVVGLAVSAAFADITLLEQAKNLAQNLAIALEHRDIIGQAKGVLMATSGVGSDEAFAMLRAASQRSNRKLYDIADEIVRRRSESN